MKKTGLFLGIGFLAGAIFFALTFGFVQKNGNNQAVISPVVASAETAPPLSTEEVGSGLNFVPVVKRVKPAVVQVISKILVETPSFFDDDFFDFFGMPRRRPEKRSQEGIGSGFFISSDGYVLTNNHVVENATKVTITTVLGEEYKAKIVGTDPQTDLALLKIEVKNVPFIPLGDSAKVEVGEWVLAIGNPLQQAFSVTAGIISAEGRKLEISDDSIQDFLQTDAAINRGNSGGPLINMRGEAIGINSIILSPSGGNIGIGFAIPSDLAKRVVGDLKTKGEVIRGYFGISYLPVNSEKEAKQYELPQPGALISTVEENSPAAKGGLKKGDLIIAVGGTQIKTGRDLVNTIANSRPGDQLKVEFFRGDKKMTLTVTVGRSPRSQSAKIAGDEESESMDLGMSLQNNSAGLSDQYNLKTEKGVVVTRVARSGIAAQNGLQPGDVIVQVNRTPVTSVSQFLKYMSERGTGTAVLMYIVRNGRESLIRFVIPEG